MADRTAEMEIFETSDVEEDALPERPEREEDPKAKELAKDIDANSVVPSVAFEVFAGKAYATPAAGFSDAARLTSRAKELTIVPNPNGPSSEPETPLQRLLRLQHETKELAMEVGAADGQSDGVDAFPADLANEVAALSRQLETMSIPASIGDSFDPQDEAAKALRVQADLTTRMIKASEQNATPDAGNAGAMYELYVTPDVPVGTHAATLKSAELEQRLSALEEALGGGGEAGTKSLVEKLESLENKVSLLDAGKLEAVGRKTSTLATHLSALLKQKRQVAPSSEQEEKIEQLYSTVEKWDGMAAAIPSVVARLHALKGLQDSSLTLKATVENMETSHAALTQQFRTQAGQVESLEKSFAENAQQITTNVASIEARIQELNGKMGKLS